MVINVTRLPKLRTRELVLDQVVRELDLLLDMGNTVCSPQSSQLLSQCPFVEK